jgi:hypothetical protein
MSFGPVVPGMDLMIFRRLRVSSGRRGRAGMSLLLAWVVVCSGLPFSPDMLTRGGMQPRKTAARVTSDKDLSRPFPCQDRPCGCRSAAQCWKRCCCFTNRQKVAWAQRHSVLLPEFVRRASERETASDRTGGCCSVSQSAPEELPVIPQLEQKCQGLDWSGPAVVVSWLAEHGSRLAPAMNPRRLASPESDRVDIEGTAPEAPPPRALRSQRRFA